MVFLGNGVELVKWRNFSGQGKNSSVITTDVWLDVVSVNYPNGRGLQ
jgi:hypothetical protein